MANSQALEETPESVVEVESKQSHGEDVEQRCGYLLKSANDVVVDAHFAVVRVDLAPCEMQQMINDEGGDDGAADHHGAAGVGGMRVVLLDIT